MALGTLTISSQPKKSASAPLDCILVSFTGDTAYPAGGTADFQTYVRETLGRDVQIFAVVKAAATGVYTPIYDVANDKLYVEVAAGTEVAPATNLGGTTFTLGLLCY